MFKRLVKAVLGNRWEPKRCCWPYPPGWATYNPAKKMVLDTGLTYEQAVEICAELNKEGE